MGGKRKKDGNSKNLSAPHQILWASKFQLNENFRDTLHSISTLFFLYTQILLGTSSGDILIFGEVHIRSSGDTPKLGMLAPVNNRGSLLCIQVSPIFWLDLKPNVLVAATFPKVMGSVLTTFQLHLQNVLPTFFLLAPL